MVESVGSSVGIKIEGVVDATPRFEDTIKTKMVSSDMTVYVVSTGVESSCMESRFIKNCRWSPGEGVSGGGRKTGENMHYLLSSFYPQ